MLETISFLAIQGSLSGTLLRAAGNSEPVGRLVVLVLVIFSVLSWAIVGRKLFQFWRVSLGNQRFLDRFEKANHDFHLAYEQAQQLGEIPLANIFTEIYLELRSLGKGESGKIIITPKTIELVQRAADRQIALEVSELDRFITVVGTITYVSPLLGLFGTVWGVLVAFTDMGIAGTTDLTVVAPGIAGALITTVFGLATAIPAAICFNYLNRRVEGHLAEMEDFVSRLVSFLDRSIQKRTVRRQPE